MILFLSSAVETFVTEEFVLALIVSVGEVGRKVPFLFTDGEELGEFGFWFGALFIGLEDVNFYQLIV